MSTLKIIIPILFFSNYLLAQGENNIWYLNSARILDFNFSPAAFTEVNTFLYTEGPKVSVSDANGNLLFISSGERVLDNTFQAMPNGTGLQGSPTNFGFTLMPVLSLPMPGQSKKYYLFTMLGGYNSFGNYTPGQLHYSIIDMDLNGGKGDIISAQKNIFLTDNLSGRLIAARGICGSLWVLVHQVNSNRYLAYEITEEGINNPIISNVGSILNGNDQHQGDGMISFSPRL